MYFSVWIDHLLRTPNGPPGVVGGLIENFSKFPTYSGPGLQWTDWTPRATPGPIKRDLKAPWNAITTRHLGLLPARRSGRLP